MGTVARMVAVRATTQAVAFVLVYPYRDALAASLRADRGALRHLDHDLHRAGTDHGVAATDRSTDPTRINGQGADSPSPTPSPSYNNSPSPTLRPARPWPSPKAVRESPVTSTTCRFVYTEMRRRG
jgi:hypothetical protein